MLYTTVINYLLLYIISICIAWTIDSCSDLVLEKMMYYKENTIITFKNITP